MQARMSIYARAMSVRTVYGPKPNSVIVAADFSALEVLMTPSPEEVARVQAEILAEDEAHAKAQDTPERRAQAAEVSRRAGLPSEHPEHIHGLRCDGQDGQSSYCERLRAKLFPPAPRKTRRRADGACDQCGDPRGPHFGACDTQ